MYLLGLILLLAAAPASAGTEPDEAYGRLEMTFEANLGQSHPDVKFFSRGNGYGLFLTPNEAVLRFSRGDSSIVRMKFAGALPDPELEGVERVATVTNYLRSEKNYTGVPNFKKVLYRDLYPGIDAAYYGNQRLLEYDFIIRPGADPTAIQVVFEGAERMFLDSDGQVVLELKGDDVLQRKPMAYQEIDGVRKTVEATYVVSGNRVGFKLGRYDRSRELVIDPVLAYSTYLGGAATASLADQGNAIAVDAAGNAYITGFTASTDFPVAAARQPAIGGGQDAFIVKLNPTGTAAVFSTYVGGDSTDAGQSIAVDAAGNIIVTGYTTSSNFPVANAVQATRGGNQDAFVLKLNNAGSTLIYSTFLGGLEDDRALGLTLDAAGNAYVTGPASSPDFPAAGGLGTPHAGGLSDAFVTKLSPAGGIVYSTLVGGRGQDQSYSIAIDPEGNAFVTGFTTSSNFPVQNGPQTQLIGTDDAFLFKLSPSGGALLYSTYFGGSGTDTGVRLVVDPDGSAVITGITSSQDFPLVNARLGVLLGTFDAFIIKFKPDGQNLEFSTFVGGLGTDSGVAIARDSDSNIYVTGFTDSLEIEAINAFQDFNAGGRDVFLMKMSPNGQTVYYSTYIGGRGADGALGIALDGARNAYVTGFTSSDNFPTNNPIRPELLGDQDGFVFKLDTQDIRSSTPVTVGPRSLSQVSTAGNSRQASFGYGRFDAASEQSRPTGIAIISEVLNGAIVSEVGMPAPAAMVAGRLYVEVNGNERTVLSLANASDQEATVDFYYTDAAGTPSKFSTATIAPHAHFSRFVSDAPISLAVNDVGTLSFSSNIPLFASSFHTLTNERSEFLINAMPVQDLNKVFVENLVIPHFADGAGWTSEIILINSTPETMRGEMRFLGPNGQPVSVLPVGAQGPAAVHGYEIPPNSLFFLETSGGEELFSGSIQLIPHGTHTPAATALLSRRESEITVSRTAVDAQLPARDFRLFAESRGNFSEPEVNSIRTGIGIANPGAAPASVRLELIASHGVPAGFSSTITVPANGQFAGFLDQIPGFANLGPPFDAILRVTTDSTTGLAVTSVRARFNQRLNFMAAALGPFNENAGTGTLLVFPHIAEGGGYTTQFLILGESGGLATAGTLGFLGADAEQLHLTLR